MTATTRPPIHRRVEGRRAAPGGARASQRRALTASLYLRRFSPYLTCAAAHVDLANGVTGLMILVGWSAAAALLILESPAPRWHCSSGSCRCWLLRRRAVARWRRTSAGRRVPRQGGPLHDGVAHPDRSGASGAAGFPFEAPGDFL